MNKTSIERMKDLRVLIVEDQMLIAEILEECLNELGCQVVGPTGSVDGALKLTNANNIDVAILDVNLGPEMVYPVAEELETRNVPFAFTTGYGDRSMPERWRTKPRLAKPYNQDQFEEFMLKVFG
jgi:response regulator RpfG family c-di-GMP phosphodiesterase